MAACKERKTSAHHKGECVRDQRDVLGPSLTLRHNGTVLGALVVSVSSFTLRCNERRSKLEPRIHTDGKTETGNLTVFLS